MKKILTIILILLSTNLSAQKGFYLKPVVGAGITGTDYWAGYEDVYLKKAEVNSIAYKITVKVGYQFSSRWKLELGLGYLSMKYGYDHVMFSYPFYHPMPLTTSYANLRSTTSYLIVPLQVVYAAPINSKFNIEPQLGYSLTYNFNMKTNGSEYDISGKKKLDYPTMNIKYKITELAGNAAIMLSYKLTNKMAITAGPAITYFMANMENLEIYNKTAAYCVTLDAGITMKL